MIIAACGDDDPPAPAAATNDAGGDSSANPAQCAPTQVNGDCLQIVCNPDGTTTSKADDTDVPPPGECGSEKCENGERVPESPKAAGSACTGGLCDGKGACSQKLGGSCATKDECPSGFCVDGVCCLDACTGECKACNVEGAKGLCTNIAFLGEDTSYENASGTKVDCTTAVGGSRCNGNGKCLRTQGTACDADATCMGGKCSAANECLGAPGELCDALADCVSNECAMGTCK